MVTTSLRLHSSKGTLLKTETNFLNGVWDGKVIVKYVASLKAQPEDTGLLLQSEIFKNSKIWSLRAALQSMV